MPLSRSDTIDLDDYDFDEEEYTQSQATLPPSSQLDVIELTDSDSEDAIQSQPPPPSSSPQYGVIELSSDEEDAVTQMRPVSVASTIAVDADSDDDLPSMDQVLNEYRNRPAVPRQTSFGQSSKRRYSQGAADNPSGSDDTPSPPKKSRLYSTIKTSPSPPPKPKKRTRKTPEEKQREKEEKDAAKARKEADRKAEQVRKEQEKLLKKQLKDIDRLKKQEEKDAKQAQRKANNRHADKKKALEDMTIVLSSTFGQHFVELLNIKMQEFGASVETSPSRLQGYDCVRFRRHIHRQYDTKVRAFVPVDPPFDKEEPAVLVRLSKETLFDLVRNQNLQQLVLTLRAAYNLPQSSQTRIFLMLFGLEKWKKSARHKWQIIEDELAVLQFDEHTHHIYVESDQEAVDRLYNVAADYGIKEQKLVERSYLPFCPNVKIEAAKGKGTYCQMLDQVHRLTISAAEGIVAEFPTMRELLDSYHELEGDPKGRERLLQGSAVKQRQDGQASARENRRLGDVLSKRVATVMYGSDPNELVVKG
ncbi:hypothetical protein D9758_009395 [Tetrapyrgos nigripes]|uniref:Crossover junction endonuclease EME1 n=1 Tax=Tetrapyrgos nigripes TaxID=182062 RepID=A0A8H5D2K8_9AGAR|nr:hypothetical protein D9758_009395 [Tetrapyrgos nigripes]